MPNFCGKCGSPLDENNICTTCGNLTGADVVDNSVAQNEYTQPEFADTVNITPETAPKKSPEEKAKLKKKIKKSKKKARRNAERTIRWKKLSTKQKATRITLKSVALLLCVVIIATTVLGALTYFGVTDVPFMNSALNKLGLTPVSDTYTYTTDFTSVKVVDEKSAITAAKDAAKKLGLSNAANELEVMLFEKVDNITYCRMNQTYKGIPVYGRSIVVTADKDGNALGFSSNLADINMVDVENTLTRGDAYLKISQYIQEAQISADNISIMMFSYDELCYIVSNDNKAKLYYDLLVCFEDKMHRVILDAKAGNVFSYEELTHNSETATYLTENGEKLNFNVSKESMFGYQLVDTERNISVYNSNSVTSHAVYEFYIKDKLRYKFNTDTKIWTDSEGYELNIDQLSGEVFDAYGNDITKEFADNYKAATVNVSFKTATDASTLIPANNITLNWSDAYSATVMYNSEKAYDYFCENFKRKGYDNKGSKLSVVYSDDLNIYGAQAYCTDIYNNAYINLASESGYDADIIAHEYTHAVINSITPLRYNGETASITEAYCDIFGQLVDGYAYDNCNWIISGCNIAEPQDTLQPQTYSKALWDDKNADIHTNSTIISRAAYLMSCDSGSKNGLNHKDLAKLWYHTLYTLPVDADCTTLREQMLLTANILSFSPKQIGCITSAFELVGIKDKNATDDNHDSPMLITVSGPVDVIITCGDDTVSSTDGLSGVSNSHCKITFNGSKSKVKNGCDSREKTVIFNSNNDHDVRLVGTAKGKISYTISFADENGNFTDNRTFNEIEVDKGTTIVTTAQSADSTLLNIDFDGDSSYDYEMEADENSIGKKVTYTYLYVILAVALLVLLFAVIYVILKKHKTPTYKRYPKTF